MKSYSATRRCGVVAITITAAAFAPMLAVVIAGTSQAQSAGKDVSSWERVDNVLVVPPVYRTDAGSAPSDACAADCPGSTSRGVDGLPTAVVGTADDPAVAGAGTADNPTDESVAVNGSTLGESGPWVQQAAADGSPQNADSTDSSLGSVRAYQGQQTAAREPGDFGIVQTPPVIIAVPVRPYYAPNYALGTFAPAAPTFASVRSLAGPAAWMPQPMVRAAPLPPLVLHGYSRAMEGFPRGFNGSFNGSFPQMPGFGGGFGHR
ncbi:MAG TPA: hypothetical protein VNE82_18340 [Candidatus Binataceae bacterium]|nr:hypothetical protein [Candidatus Binataceae bacterium]